MFNFFLFISFTLGIIVGYSIDFLILKFFLAFLFLFLIYLFYKTKNILLSDICILVFVLILGSIWIHPYRYRDKLADLKREREFTIKVTSLPLKTPKFQRYISQVKKIDGYPVSFKTYTFDYTSHLKEYLSTYVIKGTMLFPSKYKEGRLGRLYIKKNASQHKLPSKILDKISRCLTFKILEIYKKYLKEDAFYFLSAVFLGRRELMPSEIKEYFRRAGIAHLLAISGLHISFLSLVLFYLLRFFYIKFRLRLIISIFFLFLYTMVVGFNPATVRAAVMYSIFSFGFILKRKVHPLNSLGLSGLLIESVDPALVFDIGFQLSFISVFAIIFGYRFFSFKFKARNSFVIYLKNVIFSSLMVSIFIIPFTSYYFSRVNILTIVENIILLPVFAGIVFLNFIFLIFSFLSFASVYLGEVISLVVVYFLKLVKIFSYIPLSHIRFKMSCFCIFLYYLFLSLVFLGKFLWNVRKVR